MALSEIRRNAGRSLLTALGIVIGVAAVIATVTLGDSATAKVKNDVAALGNNMLILMPGNMRRGAVAASAKPLELADVTAIQREISGLTAVAPSGSRSELIVYGNKNHTSSVTGSTNAFFDIRGWTMASGRKFNDLEQLSGSASCVIGATTKKELFGSTNPLDASIRVGKMSCTVIGVTASKGQSAMGQDQDDFVLIPMSTFQRRISGSKDVDSILMSVNPKRSTTAVVRQVQSLMRERRRIQPGAEDDFDARDMKEIADTLSTVTGTLTMLLAGIAAVSLLVGGIGIMNIMLVSVTERTREIGIRLAVGARAIEVLTHFLVESAVLSLFGGVIGIGIGLGGSYAATRAFHLPFSFSPSVVALAFGFSATVGIVFGFLPARRAARLKPTEALRHE
ncbi:Macrolide export ATP-binding/permease protein MacB [Labilithrix luteola]|uniref:Macrolide export ATP-binding/permease protein MacB n=1 Tax=Labilithrix luteola TaxID=1391654 RepID=A0A0K1PSV3_9BACT|nr:ABC transporter permease [Labilithrix luteola]AKU96597.1 Macrolide export ATP-binding/permease protein MacB [Labilithrix luteola]